MTNLSALKPVTQPVMWGGWGDFVTVPVGIGSSGIVLQQEHDVQSRQGRDQEGQEADQNFCDHQLLEAWYHDSMDEMDGGGVVMGYDEKPY